MLDAIMKQPDKDGSKFIEIVNDMSLILIEVEDIKAKESVFSLMKF